MSLITNSGLVELVERGVIEGVPHDHINAASIDVTLGKTVWVEDPRGGTVWLADKQTPNMYKYDLSEKPFHLNPGEFVLAQTREVFNLPTEPVSISAEFRLKSSGARAGLDQALAVWCDPGWSGSVLTLELRNNLLNHILVLQYGTKIGQMVFWKGDSVSSDASYASRGQYCNDLEAQPSRGIR